MAGGVGAETTRKKALRATASDGDGASVPPVKQQQPAPLPAAGTTADGSVAFQSCGEADDQDDEQVERFYALLANIRALRGLYSAGTGPGAAFGRGRKRTREAAEAPWTPAFRLEDFSDEVNLNHGAADVRSAEMNQGAGGGVARRPAAARARAAVVAAADDGGHEEDKVEGGGKQAPSPRRSARMTDRC